MMPDHYLELIHAELDGRLQDEQRAELSRYLLENPPARRLRDELRQMNAALARIESVPAPEGLREAVLAAVRPTSGGGGARSNFRRSWGLSGALRYAAAFAGGIMVSAIAFQLGADHGTSLDATDLTGTMARQPAATVRPEPGVALQQGHGVATARDTASGLVLDYDLAAGQPVRIITTVTAAGEAGRPGVLLEMYADGALLQRTTLQPASGD